MTQESSRLNLSAAQVAASALAAVASAVAASTLGVAGTLIGAALGSIVATTATAVFMHSVERTRSGVRLVREATILRAGAGPASAGIETLPELTAATAPGPRPSRGLRWQPLAAAAAVVFVVALGGITAFEVASGRSVAATMRGEDVSAAGTTVGGLVGAGDRSVESSDAGESARKDPGPTPSASAEATPEATPTPSETPEATPEPSEPAATPEPSESAPTPEASEPAATPEPDSQEPTVPVTPAPEAGSDVEPAPGG
jgi:hypothetical protein